MRSHLCHSISPLTCRVTTELPLSYHIMFLSLCLQRGLGPWHGSTPRTHLACGTPQQASVGRHTVHRSPSSGSGYRCATAVGGRCWIDWCSACGKDAISFSSGGVAARPGLLPGLWGDQGAGRPLRERPIHAAFGETGIYLLLYCCCTALYMSCAYQGMRWVVRCMGKGSMPVYIT